MLFEPVRLADVSTASPALSTDTDPNEVLPFLNATVPDVTALPDASLIVAVRVTAVPGDGDVVDADKAVVVAVGAVAAE